MTSNTLIVGAVVLTAGLAGAQEPAKIEMKKQQEMEMKLQQAAEGQKIAIKRVPLEGKVVKDAPYSAEFASENVQVLPDGNRIVRRETGRIYGASRTSSRAAPGTSRSPIRPPRCRTRSIRRRRSRGRRRRELPW